MHQKLLALAIMRRDLVCFTAELRATGIHWARTSVAGARMRKWFAEFPGRMFLIVMTLGAGLITWTSLEYFDSGRVPYFVLEKLPVRYESMWLASLKVHVASALFTFPACLLLMTRWLQRRRWWHRWLGRLVGITVLGALVPSGLVLSLEAKGGPLVSAGFILSGAIVLWGIIHGVRAARSKDYGAHARGMRHVVAQMSVAVTSRAMLIGLDNLNVNPEVAYVVALWAPVVASALAAEVASRPRSFFSSSFVPLSRSTS